MDEVRCEFRQVFQLLFQIRVCFIDERHHRFNILVVSFIMLPYARQ